MYTMNKNFYFSLLYVCITSRTRLINLPARSFRQDDDDDADAGDEMT